MTSRSAPLSGRLFLSALALVLVALSAASCLPGPPFREGPVEEPSASARRPSRPAPASSLPGPLASSQAAASGPPAHAPPPSPSSEGSGASALLVVEPSGSLCSLDPATGALLWKHPARATDAAFGPDGALTAVEPAGQGGGDDPGRIVRFHEEASGPSELAELPFDGEAGRLLEAGDLLVGLTYRDGATLFASSLDGKGAGNAWGPGRSALSLGPAGAAGHAGPAGSAGSAGAASSSGRRRVLAVDEQGALWAAWAGQDAVEAEAPSPLPFAADALFERDGEALVAAVDGGIVLARTLSGELVAAGTTPAPEGAWVEEAAWQGGYVWALLGPEPELRRIGPLVEGGEGGEPGQGGELVLALGDGSWWEQPLPSRRLWASTDRAYVASGEALYLAQAGGAGLSLDPAFSPACQALSVTGRR